MSGFDMAPRTVLNAIRRGMILTDAARAAPWVNREVHDILGPKASEVIRQSSEPLLSGRHYVTHAVELRGYLDAAEGQLIRRRYKLTGDTWRGRRFSRKTGVTGGPSKCGSAFYQEAVCARRRLPRRFDVLSKVQTTEGTGLAHCAGLHEY